MNWLKGVIHARKNYGLISVKIFMLLGINSVPCTCKTSALPLRVLFTHLKMNLTYSRHLLLIIESFTYFMCMSVCSYICAYDHLLYMCTLCGGCSAHMELQKGYLLIGS